MFDTILMNLFGCRFGKPVVLDMMQVDMYDICVTKFNEVQHGLLVSIMNKSVLENQKSVSKDCFQ